jgi:hypothetical protein
MTQSKSVHPLEKLRESYKPERVGVQTTCLMIGESRPHGGTFFYQADSALYFATRRAFYEAFGGEVQLGRDFLRQFQKSGFFLTDLCTRPVNRLNDLERIGERRRGEASLGRRIESLPNATSIILVMKAIRVNVESALASSRRSDLRINLVLPFPARPNLAVDYAHQLRDYLRFSCSFVG